MWDDYTSLVLNERVVCRNVRFPRNDIETCTVDLSFVQRPSQIFRVDNRSLGSQYQALLSHSNDLLSHS